MSTDKPLGNQGVPERSSGVFDVTKIRADFPILARQVHGKPLVYLDSAATSQKPRSVIEALTHYYEHYNANVHRGVYALAEEATQAYEGAREKVARFINAPSSRTVLFTRNTTEAINLVAYAWGRRNVKAGDEILLTLMEHHSNLVPWQILAQETGATLRFIPITDEGLLELGDLDRLLTTRTRLVGIAHMSNVLGTINPVAKIAQRAHERGALVLVDGAQSVPHLPVDVQALDCDFLAFSGHKMLGPTGIGALYGREELLEEMSPFLAGGEMILRVSLEHSTYNELPWRFEAGTPNIADAIAFGAAIDYLQALGMEAVRAHEVRLATYALKLLGSLEGMSIYGPRDAQQRGAVFAFNYADIHPHDLGTILDRAGVAIRVGHHCAQPLMKRLGVAATARASFYLYNTEEEVDILATALREAGRYLGYVPGAAARRTL